MESFNKILSRKLEHFSTEEKLQLFSVILKGWGKINQFQKFKKLLQIFEIQSDIISKIKRPITVLRDFPITDQDQLMRVCSEVSNTRREHKYLLEGYLHQLSKVAVFPWSRNTILKFLSNLEETNDAESKLVE